MSGRRPTTRLIVTPEVAASVDRALFTLLAEGERVSKTDFADAVVTEGLSSLDRVKVRLRGDVPTSTAEGHAQVSSAQDPERPAVVAAIVTSSKGVLVGRRRDGKPLWTFIAGEIEPGESPADAAVREVKEETGLRVMAAEREIGRRVHPHTGRTMIYLACSPTGKTDVFVGDPEELAEVRWLSLAEAEELLTGLYEPVHQYLREHVEAS